MYKEVLKKCSKKELEYIKTSVKITRDKTQQVIDRLLKCKPEKVKDFKRKSGIVDLEKYLKFLNTSLNKLEETISTFPADIPKRKIVKKKVKDDQLKSIAILWTSFQANPRWQERSGKYYSSTGEDYYIAYKKLSPSVKKAWIESPLMRKITNRYKMSGKWDT